MTSAHMHDWLETTLVGSRQCLICGMIVTFDHREEAMPSVNDWAAKVAERIKTDILVFMAGDPILSEHALAMKKNLNVGYIAAIIASHAEPLVTLLRKAHNRHHSQGYNSESCDYPPCPKSDEDANEDEKCTCGADEWNALIDKVLEG